MKGLENWWNIHRIIVTCLTDAINLADMVPLTAAAKKFFDTAVQATLWSLWRFPGNKNDTPSPNVKENSGKKGLFSKGKQSAALYAALPVLIHGGMASLCRLYSLCSGLSLLGSNNIFVFTNASDPPVIFRPTGANRYFTLCSTEYLALGGGSHFALYLDSDLLNGSSLASETYGNSCLSHTQEFGVKEIEVLSLFHTNCGVSYSHRRDLFASDIRWASFFGSLRPGVFAGSWWAHHELGRGGWWFWDPVENASFMPRVLATACIHSVVILPLLHSWTSSPVISPLPSSLSSRPSGIASSVVLTSTGGFKSAKKGVFSQLDKFSARVELGGTVMLNMKILEEINDPNVVKILGYCMEEDLVPIIYEFMHQGTLKEYLFSIERMTERHQLISRVKIAIGVARGLVFLRTQPQLADYSLKIHNILLDEVLVFRTI
ncbi:oxidation resistance protein 1-like protein [Tanacetum coccineum]